ncbi:MAG: hypothetical protein GY851_26535 [bacterium]|nr:hypothetical protein [bacterium]
MTTTHTPTLPANLDTPAERTGYYVPVIEPVDASTFRVVTEEGRTETFTLREHWLYVRKLEHPDEYEGGLIVRTDAAREDTNTCSVLAIGPAVGQRRIRRRYLDNERKPVTRHLVNPVRLGDTILCPNDHAWGITRSPYCYFDYFVDEDVVQAILEE